jgi:hypothetical protein
MRCMVCVCVGESGRVWCSSGHPIPFSRQMSAALFLNPKPSRQPQNHRKEHRLLLIAYRSCTTLVCFVPNGTISVSVLRSIRTGYRGLPHVPDCTPERELMTWRDTSASGLQEQKSPSGKQWAHKRGLSAQLSDHRERE